MIANLLTIHDVVTANISQSFANKVAARTAGIDVEHNYITVTLCIQGGLERPLATFGQKGGKCFPHLICVGTIMPLAIGGIPRSVRLSVPALGKHLP